MANDLEFRIGAELTDIKTAIAELRKDLVSLGKIAGGGSKVFDDVEKGAKRAGQAADATRKKVDEATRPATSKRNPFQPVVDGAKPAEAAAKRVGDRLRDARGRFIGGGGGGGAGGGGGGNPFGRLQIGAAGVLPVLGSLGAALAAIYATMRLIGAADELNSLNARIKLVTGSAEEFARVQVALFDLAQRSRTGLGETVKFYTQIANATKDAGVGQEVLLGVVETINQAVQLSGASTQAAEAALVQLGQGLASGTLRGEELNSVLEQTPALADAIAKGMGITRGELRKYGEEGKITGEQVLKALQAQREEVARQFAALPLTVGQAVTQVRNASLSLLGGFDTASGATGGLASAISGLAELLSSDEVLGAVIEFGALWGQTFADIARDTEQALAIIESLFPSLLEGAGGVLSFLGQAFKEFPVNVRATVRIVSTVFAGMVDSFLADAKLLKDAFAAIFTDDTIEAAVQRRNQRVNASLAAVKDQIDDILADRDKALAEAKAAAQKAQQDRQRARATPGSTAPGNFKRAAPTAAQKGEAEALRKAQLDAEEKLLKDSTDRQKSILKDLYDDAKISFAAYFAERERLELEALDRSIEIERRRAATAANPAEREKALAEVRLLERQKGDIQRQALLDRIAAQREIEKQLEQARAQELENSGQGAEAAKIRLEAQYRDLIKRLEAEGNTAGAALIRRLIDTGVAKARFDEIKEQFDKTLSDLQAKQQSIENQRNTGALPADTAQQQQVEARAATLEHLRALNAQIQALANDPAALPAVKQGAQEAAAAIDDLAVSSLTGLDAAIVNLRASLANLQQGFANAAVGAGVDALTNLFTDLADQSKSAGEALRDFVLGFARSMAEIAARALATYLVLQALDAIYPGLGTLAVAGASVAAKKNHDGGMAGQGSGPANYPAWLFAAAPRFHNGGMVGLKSDEVPAVLQTGEEVLSRKDPRNQANGGAGGGGYRIVNVIDPNLVQDYMTSSAGERTILNVIERNAGTVRQKIGGR